MKRIVCAIFVILLLSSPMFAQDWSPTPMVIDAADIVEIAFDGTDLEIPFSLSGHNAKIWLVVETHLSDEEKPVAVMNGFKGWHFVNGIDTTVYVSTARSYDIGTNQVFPWDGTGNEKQYEDRVSTGYLEGGGGYTYYLWGYDNQSERELACDFLPIGSYWEGQYLKFYPYDETGALYEAPMLMGQVPAFLTHEALGDPIPEKIRNATIVKWQLGSDPLNPYLIETSSVPGFGEQVILHCKRADVVQASEYGAGVFDPRDHEVFYFTEYPYYAEQLQTVVKYQYVSNGEAIQDTDWGGMDNVMWPRSGDAGTNATHSVLYNLGDDTLVMLDGGTNANGGQPDRLHTLGMDDPEDEYFDIQLDEFYMPNQPVNPSDGESRSSSQLNRLAPAKRYGEFFITGDYTCLQECIDVSRLLELEGDLDPYSADGSGYVVWANSNGDFFFDMSPYADPDYPEQHWACIVSEPRNANNPRRDLSSADRNGFLVAYCEFYGSNDFGLYCPDGTGISLAGLGGKSWGLGGDNQWRNGGGEILDYGGQYDGLYVLPQLLGDPEPYHAMYTKTTWAAFDSDSGIIGDWSDDWGPPDGWEPPNAVEDSPSIFTVSQNSPNPFNPTTTITFSLAEDGPVTVEVYNVAGQKVETLADEFMSAGSHTANWDAGGFSAGVYFYTVRAGGFSKTMKMTLVK